MTRDIVAREGAVVKADDFRKVGGGGPTIAPSQLEAIRAAPGNLLSEERASHHSPFTTRWPLQNPFTHAHTMLIGISDSQEAVDSDDELDQ